MNRRPKLYHGILGIIIAGLILACKLGEPLATSTADVCGQSREPSEKDVKFLLGFTGDTFASDEWQRSYSAEDLRATVTWANDLEGGVAYAEYLLYNCGYTQNDLDLYFTEQNFKDIIFREYQNVQLVTNCATEDASLTLYEFSAIWEDEPYSLRYWVKLDSQTRVLTMMLAFPGSSIALMDHYAGVLFPNLQACQK
ncbi:MAG: hypothetical protein JXA21_27055 [Anaerolineae bacterium]|nr:hypothetical protein [Anaerolineae bacterium]